MNSTNKFRKNDSASANTIDAPQDERKIHFEHSYDSCLIVLAVFIILINILVPVLFVRNRFLRTKTNMLLVSLAIADLVMGFIGIPMFITCNAFYQFPSYAGVCFTAAVVYRFIAVSTIFHIFAITIERYIAVSYPFNYVVWVNMRRLRIVIASIWVGSLLMALVQLSWQDYSGDFQTVDPIQQRAGLIYNLIGVFVCFVIPLAAMIFIYCRMFMIIRKQIKIIKQQSVTGHQGNCQPLSSERRAITIFALMLGIFTTCWLTWYMALMSNYLDILYFQIPERLYDVFDFLRFSTSFINPVLYTFLKGDFRKALFSLISSICERFRFKRRKSTTSNSTNGFSTVVRYKGDEELSDERKKLTSV
ncbi:hypothetical protein QZH41_006416 [Actinostola sp. cb2023]|nr:hypothetical protein QZH41_006416 [Actinostola sp. cb2023]